MIEVHDLSKAFGTTQALDRVTFNIRSGEVVGFLGPNGAGKTTTMRLLTCYLKPDRGRIKVAGSEIDSDLMAVRNRIGYLPENAPLYHDLTVKETLEYVAAIRCFPRKDRAIRIQEIAGTCGLDGMLGKQVGVLSKGYRQRVGLAQAMIHDPEILILDEPTSGLDPNQIVEIRGLIQQIGREKTVLISTHILPEVQAACTRVLILHRGRLVADGEPGDLAKQLQGGVIRRVRIIGDRDTVEKVLIGAPFIAGFEFEEGGEQDGLTYRIRGAAQGEDLGERLFHLAVENGFVLTENRKVSFSLEEVFSSLTQEEAGP